MSPPLLELRHLKVLHGPVMAVHDLSLEAKTGQIVGLIGPNGAGKSSTMWAIAGINAISGGSVLLDERDITGRPPEWIVAHGLALVPEGRRIFNTLTVAENLVLGLTTVRDQARREGLQDEVFELFPVLREYRYVPAGRLSGGEQQQLAIARALLAQPRVLLLDEPSLGLAPAIIDVLFDVLNRLRARGITMLLAEQNAARTVEVSDRVYVLQGGTVRFAGTPEALAREADLSELYFGSGTLTG